MSDDHTIEEQPVSGTRQVARAARTVMLAFVIVQLLGFVRQILVPRTFGTSMELDAFYAANRIPELLFNLMAGGALASAFVPIFTGLLAMGKRERAWKLASSIANLLILILTAAAVLTFVFAPQVVQYVLFLANPEGQGADKQLVVDLLRIQLPSIVIFGLSGLVMGILNSNKKFWIPAIAPGMLSLGIIIAVLLFPQSWGIYRLAYGVVLGSLLHLIVQVPGLLRLDGKYSAILGKGIEETKQVLLLMAPRLISVAVVQINFVVNIIIGLSLAEGSVSALTTAFVIMYMPLAAIAQSVAIASMPTLSEQHALGKTEEFKSTLTSGLRSVILLTIPAIVGLIFIRYPLFNLMRSEAFDERSVAMTATALFWYAIGLLGPALIELLSRAFFALHDTKTPVITTTSTMLLNIYLCTILPGWFESMEILPLAGLAAAFSLTNGIECVLLYWLLNRRLEGLENSKVLSSLAVALASAAVMAAILYAVLFRFVPRPSVIQLTVLIVISAVVYALMLFALRVPEVLTLWRGVVRRLKPDH